MLNPMSKFVQVIQAPAEATLEVFSRGNIVRRPPIVPEIATCSKISDAIKKQWIVNSHRDLVTRKDAYNYK
jgi:hypothetical protein